MFRLYTWWIRQADNNLFNIHKLDKRKLPFNELQQPFLLSQSLPQKNLRLEALRPNALPASPHRTGPPSTPDRVDHLLMWKILDFLREAVYYFQTKFPKRRIT